MWISCIRSLGTRHLGPFIFGKKDKGDRALILSLLPNLLRPPAKSRSAAVQYVYEQNRNAN